MRRLYLRGRENVVKRQLIHVGAFNLSLIFRKKLGAGTPRELRNREETTILVHLSFWVAIQTNSAALWRRCRVLQSARRDDNAACSENCQPRNARALTTGC
jgi:hypothetical protein